MRIWIDTEFNEFKGDLISMALVAEDGREWYEVTYCENPGPWVAQHVMPILNQTPVMKIAMQNSLALFLSRFPSIHLVADWPEDLAHFCNLLITGPGFRLDTPPLTMEVRRDLESLSALPHNALEDARANMRMHLELESGGAA
jgi:hypothetical protein